MYSVGRVKVELMGQLYRKRWTIEACFQAFKERGFDLEKTHLKDFCKLKKLLALVNMTYSICTSMGIYIHLKVQQIKTKNHGYKAKSFSRKGIDTIREVFRPEQIMPAWMVNRMRALLRWAIVQVSHYQSLKKSWVEYSKIYPSKT